MDFGATWEGTLDLRRGELIVVDVVGLDNGDVGFVK